MMKGIIVVAPDVLQGQHALALRGRSIAKALSRNWIVTIISSKRMFSNEPVDASVSASGRILELSAILPLNVHSLFRRVIGEICLGIQVAVSIVRLARQPVVITSPPFVVASIAALACVIFRRPYVFDTRDLYPEVYVRAGLIKRSGFAFCGLSSFVGFLLRRSVLVCTVTEGLRNYLIKQHGLKSVEIFSNGYIAALFDRSQKVVGGRQREVVTIVSHGNFGELFDSDLFVNIASGLASRVDVPYRILLVGFGKRLPDVAKLCLPHVEVRDRCSLPEIYKLLLDCDIGLSIHLPYDADLNGFPVKVFEFIGAGLPSVVIPMHEGGRLISSLGIGFAGSSSDWETAVEYLARLITDCEFRAAVSSKVASIQSLYSLDGQMDLMAEAVDDVMSQP